MDAGLGSTKMTNVLWTSDSSVSCVVPAGVGQALAVNITSGRFKHMMALEGWFSYDSPMESAILPVNAPLSGTVAITVRGQNFGTENIYNPMIQVGDTTCARVQWISDSEMVCNSLSRGLGGELDVRVALDTASTFNTGRANADPRGLSKAMSYDRPAITAIKPTNGPPRGYFSAITIFGKNFGMGPEFPAAAVCPQSQPSQQLLFDPPDDRFCKSGMVYPNFVVPQSEGLEDDFNVEWFNIRPYSLALDPIACAFNVYKCDMLKDERTCAFIQSSCIAISNKSAPVRIKGEETTCPIDTDFIDKTPLDCARRVVSGYIKDGVTCDKREVVELESGIQSTPYFEAQGIFATDYLCKMSPRFFGACPACPVLGCCNKKGTYGARVSATECISLQWVSDSTMVCRVPPGIGNEHSILLAIDDTGGSQLSFFTKAFSYDAPTISSMSQIAVPSTGKLEITVFGAQFGTLQCNSSWCSFAEEALLCNATGCSPLGGEKRSAVVSHSLSLKADYDGPQSFRTSCLEVSWISDTAVSCTVAPGTGDLRGVQLEVMGQTNDFTPDLVQFPKERSVRYKTPTISAVFPASLPSNSGGNLTVTGSDFGIWDTGVKARLAGTACLQTYWHSQSSITCKVPRGLSAPPCKGIAGANGYEACLKAACSSSCPDGGSSTVCNYPYDTHPDVLNQGVCNSIVVTVDRLRGQMTTAFSYQPPLITALDNPNGPPRGNFNVTMMGANFGDQVAYGHTLTMGDNVCLASFWTSDSAVSCAMPKGYSFDHVPKMVVGWNSATVFDNFHRFSFDRPDLQVLKPKLVPATGGVDITVSGANFGALEEFLDTFRQAAGLPPFPPTVTIGDTVCSTSKWSSDSSVICSLSELGRGAGPGVGGALPVVMVLGGQDGQYGESFGYYPPQVKDSSAPNGPAVGGNTLLITGNHFGPFDYTPTASIGDSDCKHTRWTSNTAVRCVTQACTTFLARANLELPLRVEVGLGHRVNSFQTGSLEQFYDYESPLEVPFVLNNTEINILCFIGAIFVGALVICVFHARYRKKWAIRAPALPTRYSRSKVHLQYKLKATRLMKTEEEADRVGLTADEENNNKQDLSDSSYSSSSDDEAGPAVPEGGEPGEMDKAFSQGVRAALHVTSLANTPMLSVDVVTGASILYDPNEADVFDPGERDLLEVGQQQRHPDGMGCAETPIQSVATPIPKTHIKNKHLRY